MVCTSDPNSPFEADNLLGIDGVTSNISPANISNSIAYRGVQSVQWNVATLHKHRRKLE